MSSMRTFSIRATLAVASMLVMAGQAQAGVEPTRDHLQCYKVKDPSAYTATLAMDIGFETETLGLADTTGCVAKIRSVELCAPAAKTVESTDATIIPVVGQNLANGFLCYKIKCPKVDPVTAPVADQFGARSVTVSTVTKVCTPADW